MVETVPVRLYVFYYNEEQNGRGRDERAGDGDTGTHASKSPYFGSWLKSSIIIFKRFLRFSSADCVYLPIRRELLQEQAETLLSWSEQAPREAPLRPFYGFLPFLWS